MTRASTRAGARTLMASSVWSAAPSVWTLRTPIVTLALACVLAGGCSDREDTRDRLIAKGDALTAEGKHDEAVLQYKSAIKVDHDFGDARLKLAEAHLAAKDIRAAAQEVVRAADVMPERADAQMRAASVLLLGRQFGPAQKYAEAALKVDPGNVEAHIARAHALAGLRNDDDAIAELETVLAAAPADARPHTMIGGVNAAAGNREAAEAAFKKAIETDPKSIPARIALGHFYWSTSRPADAERVGIEALAIDGSSIPANRFLALFYLAQDRANAAERPLQQLVDRGYAPATMTLGDLYLRTGRTDKARTLYESLKARTGSRAAAVVRLAGLDYAAGKQAEAHAALDAELAASPDDALLLILKSRWLAQERRGDEALSAATRAVAAEPASAEAHYTTGMAYLAIGDHSGAINAFKESLRVNPRMTRADLQLSALLLGRRNVEQALLHAQSARTVDPDNPNTRIAVARGLFATGDLSGADSELRALRAAFPAAAVAHALHGQVLAARGDADGAARAFERALQIDPADVTALTARLAADQRTKDWTAARRRIAAALAKAPRQGHVLMLAGQVAALSGQDAEAESYFQRATEASVDNSETYAQLARHYARTKRLEEGKQALQAAAAGRADAIAARTMIGIIEQVQGNTDAAIRTFDALVQQAPQASVAANNLAYLYAERGEHLDKAIDLAHKASRLLPDNPDVTDTLGWAYYRNGMADLAVRELEFSVQMNGDNAGYLYHLGLAYAKVGNVDRAEQALTKALELDPAFPAAPQARATLASFKG